MAAPFNEKRRRVVKGKHVSPLKAVNLLFSHYSIKKGKNKKPPEGGFCYSKNRMDAFTR